MSDMLLIQEKVSEWWNPMTGYDKNYYVRHYEGGTVPVAALTEGAVIRLYFKVFEKLSPQQALKKYHDLFNNPH